MGIWPVNSIIIWSECESVNMKHQTREESTASEHSMVKNKFSVFMCICVCMCLTYHWNSPLLSSHLHTDSGPGRHTVRGHTLWCIVLAHIHTGWKKEGKKYIRPLQNQVTVKWCDSNADTESTKVYLLLTNTFVSAFIESWATLIPPTIVHFNWLAIGCFICYPRWRGGGGGWYGGQEIGETRVRGEKQVSITHSPLKQGHIWALCCTPHVM